MLRSSSQGSHTDCAAALSRSLCSTILSSSSSVALWRAFAKQLLVIVTSAAQYLHINLLLLSPTHPQPKFWPKSRHRRWRAYSKRSFDPSMIIQAKTGVRHESLYTPDSRQDQLGPHGVESVFVNQQGLKIATYFWPSVNPSQTTAVILAVHGHGAHLQNEYLKRQVCLQGQTQCAHSDPALPQH